MCGLVGNLFVFVKTGFHVARGWPRTSGPAASVSQVLGWQCVLPGTASLIKSLLAHWKLDLALSQSFVCLGYCLFSEPRTMPAV